MSYQTIPGWRPLDPFKVVRYDVSEWEELSVKEILDLAEPIEVPAWIHETTWAEIDTEGWTVHAEPAERTVMLMTRAELLDEIRDGAEDE